MAVPEGRIETADLSEDIIFVKILPRLPVKSLCRFKAVSKSWNSLLSNAMLSLSTEGRERAMVCTHMEEGNTMFYSFDQDLSLQKIPNSASGRVGNGYANVRFWGTCNGLVLLCVDGCMHLWNPSTRRCRELPQFNYLGRQFLYFDIYTTTGLCYDESSQDYKAVLLSTPRFQNSPLRSSTFVYAVSLRKRTECKDIGFPHRLSRRKLLTTMRWGTLFQGHLHWIVKEETGDAQLIVYFDERKNQFCRLTSTPTDEYYPKAKSYFGLAVLDGSLCISYSFRDGTGMEKNNLWIMSEYGIKESWTKLLTYEGDNFVPLNITSCRDTVLVWRRGYLYTYNLRNKRLKHFKLQPQGPPAIHQIPYNLRNKRPRELRVDPILVSFNDGPLMYQESLEPVDWPEQFVTREFI